MSNLAVRAALAVLAGRCGRHASPRLATIGQQTTRGNGSTISDVTTKGLS